MTRLSKTNKSTEEKLVNMTTLSDKPYIANTNNIEITVWPEFIDSKSSVIGDLFIWAYHIRIDNKSAESVKLTSRYWRIIDEQGVVQEVSGEGVVGEQPLIASGSSYQYSSGVHLRYPSGIMTGHYQMKQLNSLTGIEETFNVKIPTFSLDVPSVKSVIN
jgi:ApaG protein